MFVSGIEKKLTTWAWLLHVIGFAIAILAFTAIYVLVIAPIDKRHSAVLRQTSALKAVFATETRVRETNAELHRSLSAADATIAQLLDRIPTVPREADFLGQITTLAHEVGLEIVDYRPGGTTDREGYQEMTVTLSSEGPYSGICSFLRQLSDLPRLSKVNELKIAPRRNSETYSMEMTLAIYSPKNQTPTASMEGNHG